MHWAWRALIAAMVGEAFGTLLLESVLRSGIQGLGEVEEATATPLKHGIGTTGLSPR